MNAKRMLGLLLFVFALGSVVFMVGREMNPCTSCTNVVQPFLGDVQAQSNALLVSEVTEPLEVLNVYYMHGAKRCHTCYLLESYARDVLQQSFSNELATGRIRWKVLDVEQPENRHYITDYALITKSIVLSRQENGSEVAWENLDQIWNLVGDESAYRQYISNAVDRGVQQSQ